MNPTGSFDGGDQGLLNSFFANWAQSDNSRRLPFIYNTCSTACYSYLPAFKEWIPAHFSCENSPHRFNSNVLLFFLSLKDSVKMWKFFISSVNWNHGSSTSIQLSRSQIHLRNTNIWPNFWTYGGEFSWIRFIQNWQQTW